MPSASELERAEQEREYERIENADESDTSKGDPINYEYELKKLRTEMAGMADRAASEIETLRNQVQYLSASAEAYSTIRQILALKPQLGKCAQADFAYQLRERARELKND